MSTCAAAAVGALALILPSLAQAQYFGQNKVQYERFDFKVLATEHFDIYYYPEEEAAVRLAARMAERWYLRLSTVLNHQLSGRQPLILYAAHPHFRQTNVVSNIGEGTGGVTEMFKRRIVLPFAGGLAETDHVLGHELVHAFQYDMARQEDSEGNPVGPAVFALPLWFIEGMAEYLSLGPVDVQTAMWVRDAVARDRMPTVDQLDDPEFFPYRYGHAFWAYVAGRWGDAAVGDLLRATGPRADIDAAFKAVLGLDTDAFTRDWHADTRRTYAPFFETTRKAAEFGRQVISRSRTGGDINVAPSLSPDGRRIVFLSERSGLSIDMYLADAASGRVIRKLVETAADPHFDSLQFLSSAGDWAPDNRRFVFAAIARGRPTLTVIDVDTGRRELEQQFRSLDEIFNPAWSPDGRRIAFSAIDGGVLDLYVFDLDTRTTEQLTDDPFADLDPEWAPDGRELAWVTDRFTSNLSLLEFGAYRIGLLDLASRQARPLAGFDRGRHTNPEYSADGRSLLFIATPGDIPNLYRVDASGGTPAQLTNVLSGISGITPLTPALSVAASAQAAVFTVYEGNRYDIYMAEMPGLLAGRSPVSTGGDAAALPPSARKPSLLAKLLAAPSEGLPPPQDYPSRDYRARLSLDAVGQPVVGVGADRFGAYAAGGLSFLWSDMLGNHELGATLLLTNRFEEIGGAVSYINRTSRWNWGIVGEQTPYVTGAFVQGLATTPNFGTVFVQQTQRLTQINRAVSTVIQYPFSRALRFETAGGFRHISFDNTVETQFFSLFTGQLLDEVTDELPAPDPLNLGEASAALVWDSSVFGATSPILGQRYRVEFTQTGGTLTYSGVLADYRRYLMPARPFTIAVRGLHYGRYGPDGQDSRLAPLFLGSAGLVRGYEWNSFEASECRPDDLSPCPAFDQLLGTRIAVAGVELRFPLYGLFSRQSLYGPLPVELAVFGDAGIAWADDAGTAFRAGDRNWARSTGAAVRFNAFGYAIFEIDFVRPLDRPGRGWMWQFNLTPGF